MDCGIFTSASPHQSWPKLRHTPTRPNVTQRARAPGDKCHRAARLVHWPRRGFTMRIPPDRQSRSRNMLTSAGFHRPPARAACELESLESHHDVDGGAATKHPRRGEAQSECVGAILIIIIILLK